MVNKYLVFMFAIFVDLSHTCAHLRNRQQDKLSNSYQLIIGASLCFSRDEKYASVTRGDSFLFRATRYEAIQLNTWINISPTS